MCSNSKNRLNVITRYREYYNEQTRKDYSIIFKFQGIDEVVNIVSGLTDKMKPHRMMFPEVIEHDIDFQCYPNPKVNSLIAQIVEMEQVRAETKKATQSSYFFCFRGRESNWLIIK